MERSAAIDALKELRRIAERTARHWRSAVIDLSARYKGADSYAETNVTTQAKLRELAEWRVLVRYGTGDLEDLRKRQREAEDQRDALDQAIADIHFVYNGGYPYTKALDDGRD
jgi:hypothetical protein